jgi:hypothetical protein
MYPKQLQDKKRVTTEEMDIHLFMYGRRNYIDAYYVGYTDFILKTITLKITTNPFHCYPV